MRPNNKFIRVVLGAVVGSALWAGCATERDVAYEPAGANVLVEEQPAINWQQNMGGWHVDTHPEWRTGWNMAFPNPPFTPRAEDISIAVDQPAAMPPQTR
jgi:hypothetical protein